MRILEEAGPENYFHCSDGSILKSLTELEQKLRAAHPAVFSHHVNSQKNDFHNWVRDVFGDNELAAAILPLRSPQAMAAAIRRHLAKAEAIKAEIDKAIMQATQKVLKAKAQKTKKVKSRSAVTAKAIAAKKPRKKVDTAKPAAKAKAARKPKHKSLKPKIRKIIKPKKAKKAAKRGKAARKGSIKSHAKDQMKELLKWLKIKPIP